MKVPSGKQDVLALWAVRFLGLACAPAHFGPTPLLQGPGRRDPRSGCCQVGFPEPRNFETPEHNNCSTDCLASTPFRDFRRFIISENPNSTSPIQIIHGFPEISYLGFQTAGPLQGFRFSIEKGPLWNLVSRRTEAHRKIPFYIVVLLLLPSWFLYRN